MKTCSLLLITFLAARALQAADPVQFSVGNFAFDRPEGWTWIAPSSPMRKAQLSIPGSQGDAAADITFFHFGAGQGGGVQANVQRWFGQFQDGTTDTRNENLAGRGRLHHFLKGGLGGLHGGFRTGHLDKDIAPGALQNCAP